LKRILPIFLCLAILLTAVGFASAEADKTPDDVMDELYAQIADKEVSIEIWTGPDWKGVYDSSAGGEYTDFLNAVAQGLMERYPNIKVNVELIDGAVRAEKMSVAISSGTMPNMYYESDFALGDYIHEGIMVPINDILTQSDYDDIPQAVFEGVSYAGNTYIFPFSAEVGMIGINRSLFEAAGAAQHLPATDAHGIGVWTPDEFAAALRAVSGLEGVYPFAMFASNQSADSFTNMLLRMYGAEFVNDAGDGFAINSDEGVKALEFLLDLNAEGLIAPGTETLSFGDANAMFLNKQVALIMTNNLNYNNIEEGLLSGSVEEPFDFMWAYFPSAKDPFCLSYVKGGAIFDTGDDAEIIASKMFVRLMNMDPYLNASKVLISVRESMLQQVLESGDQIPAQAALALEHVTSITGRVPGYASIRPFFYPELQAAFTGQKTAKEALDSFTQNATAAVESAIRYSVILNP
jgi:multiple sugar transport system substrate-binding protein